MILIQFFSICLTQNSDPNRSTGPLVKRFWWSKHVQNPGWHSSPGSWFCLTETGTNEFLSNEDDSSCLHESSGRSCACMSVLLWNIIPSSSSGSTPPDCYFIRHKRVHSSNLWFPKMTEKPRKTSVKVPLFGPVRRIHNLRRHFLKHNNDKWGPIFEQ